MLKQQFSFCQNHIAMARLLALLRSEEFEVDALSGDQGFSMLLSWEIMAASVRQWRVPYPRVCTDLRCGRANHATPGDRTGRPALRK
jgi:hypothetical protein